MRLRTTNEYTRALYDAELLDDELRFDGDENPEVDDDVGRELVKRYPSVEPADGGTTETETEVEAEEIHPDDFSASELNAELREADLSDDELQELLQQERQSRNRTNAANVIMSHMTTEESNDDTN